MAWQAKLSVLTEENSSLTAKLAVVSRSQAETEAKLAEATSRGSLLEVQLVKRQGEVEEKDAKLGVVERVLAQLEAILVRFVGGSPEARVCGV